MLHLNLLRVGAAVLDTLSGCDRAGNTDAQLLFIHSYFSVVGSNSSKMMEISQSKDCSFTLYVLVFWLNASISAIQT